MPPYPLYWYTFLGCMIALAVGVLQLAFGLFS